MTAPARNHYRNAIDAIHRADERARMTGEKQYIIAHDDSFEVMCIGQVVKYGYQDMVVESVRP